MFEFFESLGLLHQIIVVTATMALIAIPFTVRDTIKTIHSIKKDKT